MVGRDVVFAVFAVVFELAVIMSSLSAKPTGVRSP